MKAQFIDVGAPAANTIHIKKVQTDYLQSSYHFHDLCELVLIQESYGKRIVGDHIGDFSAGDLVLMGPQLPHIWLNDPVFASGEAPQKVKSVVVYFPATLLTRLTDDDEITATTKWLMDNASRGIRFTGKAQKAAAMLLSGITGQKGLKKLLTFLQVIDQLATTDEFEYLSSIQFKNPWNGKEAEKINAVFQYLLQHYTQEIKLAEVATIANMTPPAFCRYFKKHTNKSLTRFINELRIGHACKLLMDETRSISDVCYESGYQNLTNFNKFFRMIRHKSPGQYRKALQSQ
ncbi:AraC family transcriptional regulator [Chitinophaga niastensis]|uniref:AraC family transcriptional regulator n=1 Tax=Chitinophaga niastensis TaxID=536980 RepID=A0A2P8HNH8_CHINA|nr:AraC family transcriptional regulator [Chitinophaga niastensis]PSL47773.1 AraC family transcriptional regulator [Chitinophaga niastensis]